MFVSKQIVPAALSVVDSLRLRLDDFVLCYLCDLRFRRCTDNGFSSINLSTHEVWNLKFPWTRLETALSLLCKVGNACLIRHAFSFSLYFTLLSGEICINYLVHDCSFLLDNYFSLEACTSRLSWVIFIRSFHISQYFQ
jgi:hypothetical protein